MKAMISQPMGGKSENEIVETRNRLIEVLEKKGYEVVNTLFTDEWYSHESMEEREGSFKFRYAFLQNLLKICPSAMQLFLLKVGRVLVVVKLSMTQHLHTVLKYFTRKTIVVKIKRLLVKYLNLYLDKGLVIRS